MQAQRDAVKDGGRDHDAWSWQQDKVWCEWKAYVQSLRLALDSESPESHLRQLLNECMAFYRASCVIPPTTDDLLTSISGSNSSRLEAAFMWLGGWRPSSAITLVYSKMGVNVGKSDGLASSITPACMLSKSQLSAMEALRDQTGKAEEEINSSLASIQMLLTDQNMTEAFGIGSSPSSCKVKQAPKSGCGVQHLMDRKLAALRNLYMHANGLRLQTLQELQNLLTPTQAAQCTVAAYELAYALRSL